MQDRHPNGVPVNKTEGCIKDASADSFAQGTRLREATHSILGTNILCCVSRKPAVVCMDAKHGEASILSREQSPEATANRPPLTGERPPQKSITANDEKGTRDDAV